MIIGFLGKGGSGKSTLATAAVRYFLNKGYRVLAIDADHNMDLSFNLGVNITSKFLGSDPYLIKRYVGLSDTADFLEAKEHAKTKGIAFKLMPPDEFTAQVTTCHEKDLLLMIAGPHTDIVRSGKHCSHSLAAPLKTYLPLLKLNEKEAVVIDERAGTDPVATGILNSVDLAIIVVEPTINSKRVAEQIRRELEIAGVNYLIVNNKKDGMETDTKRITEEIFTHIKK